MFQDSQIYAFSNVHLKIKDVRSRRTLREVHKKNTITKYALNGIASMIKGEFNDTNYNLINSYVPKYLAMGTNTAANSHSLVPSTIGESVSIDDTCLLSEIINTTASGGYKLKRVRLEDVVRESTTGDYIKIRFKTMVTSGTISTSTTIQELGLFIDNENLVGGLWARISTEPITIPENSVLDVTWDVVLSSSTGIYPTSIDILDAEGNIISDTGVEYEISSNGSYGSVYPITTNLQSSVISGTEPVVAHFVTTTITEGSKWSSTNNFNNNIRTGTLSNGTLTLVDTSPARTWTESVSSVDEALSYVNSGIDADGKSIITEDSIANKLVYKDVTYKNVRWQVGIYDNDSGSYYEIPKFSTTQSYSEGNVVLYNDAYYSCNADIAPGDWDSSKWDKIFTVINYMTDCIIINYNITAESGIKIKIVATTYNNIKASCLFKLLYSQEPGVSTYEIKPITVIYIHTDVDDPTIDPSGVLSMDGNLNEQTGIFEANTDNENVNYDENTGILSVNIDE